MSEQQTMVACPWCNGLFGQRTPHQRFCKPACKSAYSREYGVVGKAVSVRRLKRGNSVVIHTEDERVLEAPLGTRFRLVREP